MNKRNPNHDVRVLIVDDEAGILMSLRRVLLRAGLAGHQVHQAPSGEAAAARLESESFNLVLSDYRLGGMNGVELLNRVHAQDPRTARVLMTGYNEEHIAIDAINEAHVDAYVKKPWDNAQLMETVSRLLQEQRRRIAQEQTIAHARTLAAAAKGATRVRPVHGDTLA